ncbi:hypothetical protein ACVIGB_000882 [Bradyrhizobium sp. USDA 4341]
MKNAVIEGFDARHQPREKNDRWVGGAGGSLESEYEQRAKENRDDWELIRRKEPLPFHDSLEPKFIRFGDIPKGERSSVGQSPNWIYTMLDQGKGTRLKGVSVYRAKYNSKRNLWEIDTRSSGLTEGGYASLGELLASQDTHLSEFVGGGHQYDENGNYLGWIAPDPKIIKNPEKNIRPIYLVTGKELGEEGTDGEPLLRNVKTLDRLSVQELVHPGYFNPDTDIYLENNPGAFRRKLTKTFCESAEDQPAPSP